MTEPDRAEAMARRLDRTARRLGMDAEGAGLVVSAFRTAMEPRRRAIAEDHHPDYLHPARTALILMDDARVADARVLAVAALAETRAPELRADPAAIRELGRGIPEDVDSIPDRADDRLLERLLLLEPPLATVALAERLDHARHLHLREREEWTSYHTTTCEVYAPLAGRVEPALAARLEWWCATFARRFLQR